MIQDIEPHEYRNEYQPLPPDEDSIFLAYSGRTILAAMEGRQISFPYIWRNGSYMDRQKLYEDYTYLFAIDGMRFYLGNPLGISERRAGDRFQDRSKGYEMLDTQTPSGGRAKVPELCRSHRMAAAQMVYQQKILWKMRKPNGKGR